MTETPQTPPDPVVDRILVAERLTAIIGFILIVLAFGAVDWRLGALVMGIMLVAVTIDLPWRSRR